MPMVDKATQVDESLLPPKPPPKAPQPKPAEKKPPAIEGEKISLGTQKPESSYKPS